MKMIFNTARALGLATLLLASVASVVSALGPWTNGQAATRVLGQADFTSNTAGTTASTMRHPGDVAVDPTTGKVFIADVDNHRVLRFASGAALVNGAAAEAVLGQPNLNSGVDGAPTAANTMHGPFGVFVDASGRLWVADTMNNRVLRFDNAASKLIGANADGVLGQTDFTGGGSAVAQNRMYAPRGLAVDSAGRLWVADQGNNRVLRFDTAAAKANGANADGVLGQSNFTTGAIASTQNGMWFPSGVAVSSSGALFVPDAYNHRVLRFDSASAKANGANANRVLGQTNFTNNSPALTQNGMNTPYGVGYDDEGRLYVADDYNSRVLIFNNATALANGANANNVLGQVDFTSSGVVISASTLGEPTKVFADNAAGVLWVADKSRNRVVRYLTPTSPPASTVLLYLPLVTK